jgi:hypothetical protein
MARNPSSCRRDEVLERRALRDQARQREEAEREKKAKSQKSRAAPPTRSKLSTTREAPRSKEKESALEELVARRNRAVDGSNRRRMEQDRRRREESMSPKRKGRGESDEGSSSDVSCRVLVFARDVMNEWGGKRWGMLFWNEQVVP